MEDLENEWNRIEKMFTELVEQLNVDLPIILKTIRELRAKGYDMHLRPGSSLYKLILSRSIKYGLRGDQPSIAISAGKNKYNIEGGEVLVQIRNLNGKDDGFSTSDPLTDQKFLRYLDELKNCPCT